MLKDLTSEEHVDTIFKRTESLYDKYCARRGAKPFTPTFRVVEDAAQHLQLEIVTPVTRKTVGSVPLKALNVGDGTILTIADQAAARKTKRVGQAKHSNAGYCLNEIRRQLRQDPDISPQVKRLGTDARAQLESFLDTCQMRAQAKGMYTLDMDVTDEGVTLVAYVDHKRMGALSVFF
jgi:hypothetical protein